MHVTITRRQWMHRRSMQHLESKFGAPLIKRTDSGKETKKEGRKGRSVRGWAEPCKKKKNNNRESDISAYLQRRDGDCTTMKVTQMGEGGREGVDERERRPTRRSGPQQSC